MQLKVSTETSPTVQRIVRVLYRAFRDMPLDNSFQWASAIAFYSIFSLIPLLLAVTSTAAHIISPEWAVTQARYFIGDMLPPGDTRIERFMQSAMNVRRSINILSIAALIFTGSRIFSVTRRALNISYCTYENQRFLKRTGIEIIMSATLGVLLTLALFSRFFFKYLLNNFGITGADNYGFFRLFMELLSALLLTVVFFIVYSRIPRIRLHQASTLAGAAASTCLLLVIRPFFILYIREFTNYHAVYGSLALIAILLFWAWLIAVIVLYGGAVASHYQMMVIEGKTEEETRGIHLHRSPTYTDEKFQKSF